MKTRRLALLVAGLITALAAVAAACDDDDTDTAGAQNSGSQSVDALSERMQRHEMMYAIILIDGLGLHGMDEAIAEGNIEFSHTPATRTLIRLLALTDWDDELQADADAIHDEAVRLLQALRDGDAEAAAEPARIVHEDAHDFSDAVWALLAADLPADAGGPAGHGDEDGDANGHGDDNGGDEEAGDDHEGE